MYPNHFQYFRPGTVQEAIGLLTQLGPDARLLAGGQSLIPLLKLRMAAPRALIDMSRIPGLSGLDSTGETVRLGALVRHRTIESTPLPGHLAILHDAATVIADVQVRSRGTVGGALAQADPGGDWGPVFLALDAEVTAAGPRGERAIPVRELFLDAYTTALEPDEMLTEIRFTAAGARRGGAYLALKQRTGDFAIASAAVQLAIGEDGVCLKAGIGLGGVGLTPIKPVRAEQILTGSRLDEQTVAAAVAAAVEVTDPMDDLHGDSEYKREVAGVLVRRAITAAIRRSSGERVDVHDYV